MLGECENCSCVGGVVAWVGIEGVDADGFELGLDELDGDEDWAPCGSPSDAPARVPGCGVALRAGSLGSPSARITVDDSGLGGLTSGSVVGTE